MYSNTLRGRDLKELSRRIKMEAADIYVHPSVTDRLRNRPLNCDENWYTNVFFIGEGFYAIQVALARH